MKSTRNCCEHLINCVWPKLEKNDSYPIFLNLWIKKRRKPGGVKRNVVLSSENIDTFWNSSSTIFLGEHIYQLWVILHVLLSLPLLSEENVETITHGKTVLTSPNYPRRYPSNQHKEWIFNQTTGHWAMTIKDFLLEESGQCVKDYLLIRRSRSTYT